MADFFRLASVKCDVNEILRTRGLEERGRVQQFIDNECLKLCAEKVPKDIGALIESGTLNTQIGSGEIKYRTPYARRWYYMPADFQEGSGSGTETVGRGNYWFYRMKKENRENILKGAQKKANGGSQ